MLSKWLYFATTEGDTMKMLYDKNRIEKLNRRNALKIMGIGGASLMLGSSNSAYAKTNLPLPSSKKKANIVIAGGGTGGMIAAARLRRSVPNARITLISPNSVHLYQSGQVYVAAGIYSEFDNRRQTSELLPDNVTWLQEKVTAFDPDNKKVESEKSGEISYDYLVVALGCEYGFSSIEGFQVSDIGSDGISSVYLNDTIAGTAPGGIITRQWIKSIRRKASRGRVNVLVTTPDTPVKGEGVSLDMIFLCNDFLRGNGPKKGEDFHKNAQFTLAKAGRTVSDSPLIGKALNKLLKSAGNIETKFGHTLKAIDKKKKIATLKTGESETQISYDYIHITPPMQAPQVLRESKLAISDGKLKGWMKVDERTLQHPQYKNVFGIGDILGLEVSKSGGAVREQAILIQDNVAADLEGEIMPIHYDGYTAVPFRTAYGKVMLAEYNNKGLAPTFPLDPAKSRWIWWEVDVHLMRRAYFDLMMRGMM